MQARHALQAAAKQFGFDGTERSLAVLLAAVVTYQQPPTWQYDAGTFKVHGDQPQFESEKYAAEVRELAGETFLSLPASFREESHAE